MKVKKNKIHIVQKGIPKKIVLLRRFFSLFKLSAPGVLLTFLIALFVVFYSLSRAAAPDPGHTWTEVGDVALTVAQGGTGASTFASGSILVGAGTNAITASTTLSTIRGGTGLSTLAQGDILYAAGASELSRLAKDTNATRYVANTGTSNNPAWAQVDLSNGITGNLPYTNFNSGTNARVGTIWRGDGSWDYATGTLVGLKVYTTEGANTWYKPHYVTRVVAEIIGGGGGGGGTTTAANNAAAGAGGGGGAYTRVYCTSPGDSETATVGGAGTAGSSSGGTGGTGGTSSFTCNGTTYSANGGSGGVGQAAGTAVTPTEGGAGGTAASAGDVKVAGGPGRTGYRLSGTVGASGGGGSSVLGGGAVGTTTAAGLNGYDGYVYGGGGGGGLVLSGSSAVQGGAGALGLVLVWEYE